MGEILKKYSPQDYEYEKVIGRRGPTGEMKLRRLKAIHRQMIAYHLRGLSNRDIQTLTGFSEVAISRILRDPLSQAYVNVVLEGTEAELRALNPLAVDAIRSGLCSESENTKLKAADQLFKATGRYNREAAGEESAEDVVGRLLSIMKDQTHVMSNLTKPNPMERLINITPENEFIEEQKLLEKSGAGSAPSRSPLAKEKLNGSD